LEANNFQKVIVFRVWGKDGATVKWAGLPRHVGLVAIVLSFRVLHLIFDLREQLVEID
jgi:hypothetical protein